MTTSIGKIMNMKYAMSSLILYMYFEYYLHVCCIHGFTTIYMCAVYMVLILFTCVLYTWFYYYLHVCCIHGLNTIYMCAVYMVLILFTCVLYTWS